MFEENNMIEPEEQQQQMENSLLQSDPAREREEYIKMRKNMRKEYARGRQNGMIAGIAIACLIVVVVYLVSAIKNSDVIDPSKLKQAEGTVLEDAGVYQKVRAIESLLESEFLYDVDTDKLVEGMYAGLVAGLEDQYSAYYTEEQYQALMEDGSGEYEGIGVTVAQDTTNNQIHIVSVFEGSPAADAGLKAGDIITKVNDESADNMTMNDVVDKIRNGENKTSVITVLRKDKTKEISVTRENVTVPSVAKSMLDDDIGYIVISQFSMNTTEQFIQAYEELEKDGMKGLVIDIRNNPGGMLTTVCDMLDSLLPEGLIMYEVDKSGNKVEQKSDAEYMLNVPLVVLVNENSASASEVFSGVVQDYEIGTIVGTTTYGKGVVQSVIPFADGSAVKLTVQKYYTAKGQDIDGKGIQPDVVCEVPEELAGQTYFAYEDDVQLHKAEEIVKEKIK